MNDSQTALPDSASVLIEKFKNHEARVGVIGLGYVGLPLALAFARAGNKVIGVDTNAAIVESLGRGVSHIDSIEDVEIETQIEQGNLDAASSYQALKGVDAISISVPTPLRKTGDPDLSFILKAMNSLIDVLQKPMLIVLESTTYPGTTREILQPQIEEAGWTVGEDIFLAFSPERVDPGREDWTTENTPKVVGGVTPACTEVAAAYYEQAIDEVIKVGSSEVAEMTKLLENTFRAVNIAMVNEMALMCERLGIDVWEVIDAAASKPFGFMPFKPGPGLGGHCIPIDPMYLSWKLKTVKYNARFIDLASEINTEMPRYVVDRVQNLLNDRSKALRGAEILVLGAAYKADVSDTRESPALDVIGLLKETGAEVSYYDPFVPLIETDEWSMSAVEDLMRAAASSDCVVVITDHKQIDYAAVAEAAEVVFDTRNVFAASGDLPSNVVRM